MGRSSRRKAATERDDRLGRRAAPAFVARPFAGLPGECDWVAMREIVPAAAATVRLAADGRQHVGVATVLPFAAAATRRSDGSVWLGLQCPGGSGDPGRELGAALLRALEAEPGTVVGIGEVADPAGEGTGPRLAELVDPSSGFPVRVADGFDFWLDGLEADPDAAAITASMERANAAVVPTARLAAVEAAYWCRVRDRCHLRWVLPFDEEPLLDAMARVRTAGGDGMGEGSRYAGSFRAAGLVVPVWDLPVTMEPDEVEDPAAAYLERLREALADPAPLTADERRARHGLLGRQLTLR